MKNKLSCGIVRDLLPSYVDGLTCQETNAAVELHMKECGECKAVLEMIKEPEKASAETEEVDYLKKVNRKGRRRAVLTGLISVGIVLAVLGFGFFCIGKETKVSDVAYQTETADDRISIKGMLVSSGLGISRVTEKKEGDVVSLKVYTTLKTFFNSGDFYKELQIDEGVRQVRLGGLIVWEDGKVISRTAARLYEAKNPYVGDMSANAEITNILFQQTSQQFDVWEGLGLLGKYGGFRNELYTTREPYGWCLTLQEDQMDDPEKLYEEMRSDACMMLATIENLSYVIWKFEAEGEPYEYKFRGEDATEFTGQDIKSWSESAAKLQELCELLDIP